MVEALDLKKAQLDGLIGEQQLGPVKKIDSQAYIRQLAQQYIKSAAG